MSRIAVMTAGHPSTCPRMVKAADALSEAGHDVRLICTRFIDWAVETDRQVLGSRRWRTTVVDYASASAPVRSRWVRARRRAAAALIDRSGAARGSWWAVTRTYSYVHPELVKAALAEPADYFYGGTTGALAAVEEAASRASRPFGLDFEDLHTAESEGPDAAVQHALAARIESRVVPRATVLTTSSEAIAEAYRERYQRRPDVIHNVFPLPAIAPVLSRRDGPLRCYWFSQTIGPGRGLDEFVAAAGLLDTPIALTLQGRPIPMYVEALRARAAAVAPLLSLDVLPPTTPDALMNVAARHDIGLSLELPTVENRDRTISNKFFTALAAGLALIATSTRGQRPLTDTVGEAVAWCAPGDPRSLADALRRWHLDRDALLGARQASWYAAATRWHWGHPCESARLVSLIESSLR